MRSGGGVSATGVELKSGHKLQNRGVRTVAVEAEAGRCAGEEGTEHATFLELLDRVKGPDT